MTKEFDELMMVVKYGDDTQKAILLKALLIEKEKRELAAIKEVCDKLAGSD